MGGHHGAHYLHFVGTNDGDGSMHDMRCTRMCNVCCTTTAAMPNVCTTCANMLRATTTGMPDLCTCGSGVPDLCTCGSGVPDLCTSGSGVPLPVDRNRFMEQS